VHALICPRPDCGHELWGLPYDKVFFCANCGEGVIFRGTSIDTVKVTFAMPLLSEDGPRRHLPFWRIAGTPKTHGATHKQHRAFERVKELQTIWVAAFLTVRKETYGDFGELLTRRRPAISPQKTDMAPPRLIGAVRDAEAAVRYAELGLLSMVDKRADVTGMSLTIDTAEAALWGLPFVDRGDRLTSLLIEADIPAASLPDLLEIRKHDGSPTDESD
jgi:hypothetical protein